MNNLLPPVHLSLQLALFALLVGCAHVAVAADDGVKLPIPSNADQQQASKRIASLFKSEYEQASTQELKAATINKVLRLGRETQNNPAEKYVLFRIGREMALQAGEPQLALTAVDSIDRRYQIDRRQLQLETLTKLTHGPRAAENREFLAQVLAQCIQESLQANRYDLAKSFHGLAVHNADGNAAWTDLASQIEAAEQEFLQVESAASALDLRPLDPDLNYAVGRYQCFVRQDWRNGILLLALGADPQLKALARKELAHPTEHYQLGNAWWDYAATATGSTRHTSKQRAAHWYRNALPSLDGFSRELAASRIRLVQEPLADADSSLPHVGNLPAGAAGIYVFEKKPFETLTKGTIIHDLSGNDRHAVIGLAVKEPRTSAGSAIGARLPKPLLNRQPNFTVLAWLKPSGKKESLIRDQNLFVEYIGGNSLDYRIRISGKNALVVRAEHAKRPQQWLEIESELNAFRPGEWNFVALRLTSGGADDGTATIFINGGKADVSFLESDSGTALREAWIAPGYSGVLDFIAIYPHALTDEEIRAIYENRPQLAAQ